MNQKLLIFFITWIFFASCNSFDKLLKSNDYEKKYQAAVKYYKEENYIRAYPLLEELIGIYRGTGKAEEIYYFYCWTNYHMEDYIFAGFHFKNFVKTYPSSQYAEECFYQAAYCHYLQSPKYSLDQTETKSAIDEFQQFADRYPDSKKMPEVNEMVDKLRMKLETKAYEICKQYYKREQYKSAVIAIKNALRDYPGTKYAEELSFLIIKSNFDLAYNSIDSKKQERFNETLESYYKFVDKYPDSIFRKEAEKIYQKTIQSLKFYSA
jgi:outer membrane protein assembly factor BamD